MQRLDVTGNDQRDTPLDTLAQEPVVDQVGVAPADDDGDVPRIQKDVAPAKPCARGMTDRTASVSRSV